MRFSTRSNGGLERLKQQLLAIKARNAYAKAGFLGSASRDDGLSNAELASIHEYGTKKLPARPFVGPAFEANRSQYGKMLVSAYTEAVKAGDVTKYLHVLKLLGAKMAADIKNYITQGKVQPPSSDATNERKGSSRTLVDTGQLVNSVTWEVVE